MESRYIVFTSKRSTWKRFIFRVQTSGILATKSPFFSLLPCWPLISGLVGVQLGSLRFISDVNKEILCSINRERTLFSHLKVTPHDAMSLAIYFLKRQLTKIKSRKLFLERHLPMNFVNWLRKVVLQNHRLFCSKFHQWKNSECKFQTCIQKFLLQRDQTSSAIQHSE